MKMLVGALVGGTVLIGVLIAPTHAITITDATLSSGTITVSGSKAAKLAAITWEGTTVTQTNKGGAFTFTTAVVPQDCVGTLGDGVSTVDVAITGCTAAPPTSPLLATGQTTCWDSSGNVVACGGTGQDGEILAGAALSYTDNGDGTITDNNTALMWGKRALTARSTTRTPSTRGSMPSPSTPRD
jgi:hypothetical protein